MSDESIRIFLYSEIEVLRRQNRQMLAALHAVQALVQFNEHSQRFDFDGEPVEHRERLKSVLIEVADALHAAHGPR